MNDLPTKICPDCAGTGNASDDGELITCRTCGGYGEVPMTKQDVEKGFTHE